MLARIIQAVTIKMKTDLVIWTYNSAKTLVPVLSRIAKVIPRSIIHNKIIVDDFSTDNTRDIAESFGWNVYFKDGEKGNIGDSANTALKHVETECFISFEHDLLLNREWWSRIPPLLNNPKVAVASGCRVPSQPIGLRKLQEYTTNRYMTLEKEKETLFIWGKTLDNTIYKTEVIREMGGFPRLSVGVDNAMAYQVHDSGYEWKVAYDLLSLHLRTGLKQELSHYYWYGLNTRMILQYLHNRTPNIPRMIARLLFSPIRGLLVALTKNSPTVVYIYPLIRFSILKGVLKGK